jgi:hypothetical protein
MQGLFLQLEAEHQKDLSAMWPIFAAMHYFVQQLVSNPLVDILNNMLWRTHLMGPFCAAQLEQDPICNLSDNQR